LTLEAGSGDVKATVAHAQIAMKSDWERKVESTLRDLGVPIEFSVADLDAAVAQSFAALTVYFAQQQLEQGHPAEAVSALDGAIACLQPQRGGPLTRLLALAYYLRGTAHERQRMRMHALDDYAMTLGLWPQHPGARHALDLLGRRPERPGDRQ
jgi:hypothetical protein